MAKRKKGSALCRRVLHRVDNGRRLLFITCKEDKTQNLQDEGGGKEKHAGEYVAL